MVPGCHDAPRGLFQQIHRRLDCGPNHVDSVFHFTDDFVFLRNVRHRRGVCGIKRASSCGGRGIVTFSLADVRPLACVRLGQGRGCNRSLGRFAVAHKSEHCYDTAMAKSKQQKSEQRSELTSTEVRMARAALGWGVRDLAAAAKVSGDTINRLEMGEALRERTLAAIRASMEKAGIVFINPNGGGPGVRLKKRPKK